jgi:hypothetical protein
MPGHQMVITTMIIIAGNVMKNQKTKIQWEGPLDIDNLTTLFGLAGTVGDYTEIIGNRSYLVGNTLTLDDDLNIYENANIYISGENARIDIVNGQLHTLSNVSFYGSEINNYNDFYIGQQNTINNCNLLIDGDIYDGQQATFNNCNLQIDNDIGQLATFNNCNLQVDDDIDVGQLATFNNTELYLNNHSLQTTFNNATFNNCNLHNYGIGLDITNSQFVESEINSYLGDVSISNNSTFTNSWLHLENQWGESLFKVTITNCEFSNGIGKPGIDIWNYDDFAIENNNIHDLYNGIQIVNCGEGKGDQNIYENNIYNNSSSGIIIYNSNASIWKNEIKFNNYGVKFYNNSNIGLYGNPNAQSLSGTQYIHDNDSYEVYASQNSFPFYFKHNGIIDEDNASAPSYPLVYHNQGNTILKDVRYNCWGVNFDASEDLYPNGYIWEPTWCPPDNTDETDEDEQLFMSAQSLVEQENYTDAKNSFQLLIELYPESKYADASMKELFGLEKFVSNDYTGLQQYYETNCTIQSDTSLNKLGGFLINKCNLKLEKWDSAIIWYENIIQNPQNLEDSIFAIIDLGYAYMLMENGGMKSSSYVGTMLQYKFVTVEAFEENRDYLLSLLPGDVTKISDATKNRISALNGGELLQNIPNPFSGKTKIFYKLEKEVFVTISVFDYTGKLIKTYNEGTKSEGVHSVEFNANGLSSGMYFYSIDVNGVRTDSKKMIVEQITGYINF